jgi:hypothetical protein
MAPQNRFLTAVSNEPDKSAHSFVLTGRPGIGKTYFVSTIDKAFILPIEEGLKGISPDHRPAHFTSTPRNLTELEQALDAFCQLNAPVDGKRPYAHLALDSLSGIEGLIHEQACAEEGVRHMEGKDFGKVFAAALPLFARVQKRLDSVRKTGTHVWLIAHAQETSEANEDGDQFRRWDLAFRGSPSKAAEVRSLWRQWADHVFFLDWDLSVRSQKGKRTVGKLRARVLRTRESGFAFAKTRARLPDVLPATWEDLRAAMASGTPAPEGRLRAQLEEVLGKLADEASVATLRRELAKAQGANRVAALLSRAQGFLAVERANGADLTGSDGEPEPPAAAAAPVADDVLVDDDGVIVEPPAEDLVAEVASPLVDSVDREVADVLCEQIEDASDQGALAALVPQIKAAALPKAEEDRVRSVYAAKRFALQGAR